MGALIVQTIDNQKTYPKDIHMEFGMEKYKAIHIEKGKVIIGDGAIPNDRV